MKLVSDDSELGCLCAHTGEKECDQSLFGEGSDGRGKIEQKGNSRAKETSYNENAKIFRSGN